MTITNTRNASTANPASNGHRSRSRRRTLALPLNRRALLASARYWGAVIGSTYIFFFGCAVLRDHVQSGIEREQEQTELLEQILWAIEAQNPDAQAADYLY